MTALCQNSKTKYFGRLFLAFVMLLGGVFITNTYAKADFDTSVIEAFNFYNNSGAGLIHSNNNIPAAAWANGLTSDPYDKSLNVKVPSYGDMNLTISNSDTTLNNGGAMSFNIKKDSTSDFLYLNFENAGSNKLFNYLMINESGTLSNFIPKAGSCSQTTGGFTLPDNNWHHFLVTSDTTDARVYLDGTEVYTCHYSQTQTFTNIGTGGAFGLLQFYNTSYDIDNVIFFNRNLTTSEISSVAALTDITSISFIPPSTSYVMYYGANPVYTKINENYDLSVVYNVCDNWQYGNGSAVLTLNNDNASSSSQVLYNCSGTVKFNKPAGISEMSNVSYFTIEKLGIPNTILAKGNNFLSTVYKPLTAKDGFIIWDFQPYQYIDYSKETAGTTTLPFTYNVCNDANYSTSSKICIHSGDYLENSPTQYCSTLATCSGTSTIEFPLIDQEHTFVLNFAYYDNNNQRQLVSNNFNLVFYNGVLNETEKWKVDAKNVACTAEEWADTNWWTQFRCGSATTFVVIGQSIGSSVKTVLSMFLRGLEFVFPFNFPIKIYDCWIQSETALLPTELEPINFLDVNGNVKVNLPTEWSASSSITLWGKDVFESTSALTLLFAFIRALTKYGLWAGFIFGVWYVGHDIYDEITKNKKDDYS